MPIIHVKNKNIKEVHLENLFILQDFQCDSQAVWIAKLSYDGKYLATGGQSGVLKIWSVYSEEESLDNYEYKGLLSYIKLINENAYRVYNEHVSDIVDMSWNMTVLKS
jgi:WD40 repeat protein